MNINLSNNYLGQYKCKLVYRIDKQILGNKTQLYVKVNLFAKRSIFKKILLFILN